MADNTLDTIRHTIAALDAQLSEQLTKIIHAEEFQKLESAWRGLHYLVSHSNTDAALKIRVMNVSKTEMRDRLRLYPGKRWDRSFLFEQVYEAEFAQLGGEPYGCLIADYYFSHRPDDVRLLQDISKVAASAHSPFLAAVDLTIFGRHDGYGSTIRHDLDEVFETPDYAAWVALRHAPESRYLGLCLPRVLARLPYGAKAQPEADFAFEETTDGGIGKRHAWMNAAYVMAVNINRAFTEFGWCARICGAQTGGETTDLPAQTFPSAHHNVASHRSTEVAIDGLQGQRLIELGLIPLVGGDHTNQGTFVSAPSLFCSTALDEVQATTSGCSSAGLPATFATSRFAHYLKCIVRDQSGTIGVAATLTASLQSWIDRYVDCCSTYAVDDTAADRSLSAAKVAVIENTENPGSYYTTAMIRPSFQLGENQTEYVVVLRDPWFSTTRSHADLLVSDQTIGGTNP